MHHCWLTAAPPPGSAHGVSAYRPAPGAAACPPSPCTFSHIPSAAAHCGCLPFSLLCITPCLQLPTALPSLYLPCIPSCLQLRILARLAEADSLEKVPLSKLEVQEFSVVEAVFPVLVGAPSLQLLATLGGSVGD
jgi:hypothetical protein